MSPVKSTSSTFRVTEPGNGRGVEHLDLVVPQADHIPLVVELQIVHLAGQGEQGTARPVGVSLVDIDIRLGIHPVEAGTAVVWS